MTRVRLASGGWLGPRTWRAFRSPGSARLVPLPWFRSRGSAPLVPLPSCSVFWLCRMEEVLQEKFASPVTSATSVTAHPAEPSWLGRRGASENGRRENRSHASGAKNRNHVSGGKNRNHASGAKIAAPRRSAPQRSKKGARSRRPDPQKRRYACGTATTRSISTRMFASSEPTVVRAG